MSHLDPKSLLLLIYNAFNQRNSDALDALMAPGFLDHTAGRTQAPGVEGIKEVWSWIWSEYPEVSIHVEDVLSEGDKVAARVTFQTPLENGQKEIGWMIEIVQVVDGKAVALWNMIQWT